MIATSYRHIVQRVGVRSGHPIVEGTLALQLRRLAEEQSVTKTEIAARMKTSRAAVDRLLDASNPSLTLSTLGKAAWALGRKAEIELVPA